MAQDVGRLIGVEHEVDRHQHRAQPGQCKTQRSKTMRVARQHAHMLALGHALGLQAGGQAADDGIKFTPGPGHIGTQDGGLVGQPGGGAVQQVGQGLAADGGMVLHAGLLMRVRLHRSGWAGTRLSGPSRGQ
jgi:hypothetical protein